MRRIPRDPGGPETPLDICFCGERKPAHPTADGCMEFQSFRLVTNTIANVVSDVVETLVLIKMADARRTQ